MEATSVIRQKQAVHQDVVVCKIPTVEVSAAEVLPKSRPAPELSCCLQDSGVRHPAARRLRRNVLGRKLSCCLQDRADAVFGLARAATDGSARPRPGAAPGIVANNRDGGIAISEGYRGTPADIPGPRQSSGGDTQRAGG